jgi:uncharacterized OB-fold protein
MSSAAPEAGRPEPVTSELTKPFWQACREHQLLVQRCNTCGVRFFTPEVACTGCAGFDWAWTGSAGVGTVYSFTVVHRAAGPEFETPYVVAAVDLDEGWTMMTHIVSCPADDVVIGLRVRVEFVAVSPTLTLPCFRPDPAFGVAG